MNSPSQRAVFVIEHVSAISDHQDEIDTDSDTWFVVAYLVLDSGRRERVTLHSCGSRADASAALDKIWEQVTSR